jgi:hypothetical protein
MVVDVIVAPSVVERRVLEDPSPPSDALVDSLVSLEDGVGVRDTREQTRVFDGCDVQTRRSGLVASPKPNAARPCERKSS